MTARLGPESGRCPVLCIMSRCRLGISRAVALVVAAVLGLVLLLVSGKPKATQYRQKTSRLGVRGEKSVFNSLPLRAIVAGHSVVIPEGVHNTLENSDTVVGLDYLFRIYWNCSTKACTQFLTEKDEPHFKYCIKKTWNVELKEHTEPDNTTCVFINGSSRHPMALASYPGSGNTWVRGLLQRTTGLCTGAIYCDVTLRKNGFPGESIRSGAAFLVKTHQTDPRWEFVQYSRSDPFLYFKRLQDVPVFAGGVFIIRNPFHAMVAEYKRIMWEDKPDNHVRNLGIKYFGKDIKHTHAHRISFALGKCLDLFLLNKTLL